MRAVWSSRAPGPALRLCANSVGVLCLFLLLTSLGVACEARQRPMRPEETPTPYGFPAVGSEDAYAAGAVIFAHECSVCHGPDGNSLRLVPLTSSSFLDQFTEAELVTAVLEGDGEMPGYAGILEQRHAAAVVVYLNETAGRASSRALTAMSQSAGDGLCATCHGVDGSRFPQDGGRAIYTRACSTCHGESGGKVPDVPIFSGDFLEQRGDVAVLASVTGGTSDFGRSHGGTLSEQEVREVIAFVNTSAQRASPIIQADQGELLYTRNCQTCHGATGDRIPIAPLDTQGFLDSFTDDELQDVVLNGTRTMVGLGPAGAGLVTAPEAGAIVSFLRYRVDIRTVRNISAGRDLYLGACAGCHGLDGGQIGGARLGDDEYITSHSDAQLAAAIRHDAEGGAFQATNQSRGSLTFQTAALLTYLKSRAGVGPATALPLSTERRAGEDLYEANCVVCHGNSGNWVPNVQLKSPAFLALRSRAVVVTTIRSGNDRGMPAWGVASGGPLSDEDVDAIATYLYDGAGLYGDDGTLARDMLGDLEGARLYATICSGCHGVDRSGGIGPALLPETLTRSDERYRQIIASGVPSTRMPAWRDQGLTSEEIASLVRYLRSEPVAVGMSSFVSAGIGEQLYGAELYAVTCAFCHGERGLAVPQCPLASSDWLSFMAPGELERRIGRGNPNAGMPTWSEQFGGPLTDEQLASLAEFIMSSWR